MCQLHNGEQIQIDLSLKLELADPEYFSFGIKPPPGLPYHLMEKLWVQGIDTGIHAAIVKSGYDLSKHDLEFAILELKLSIPFDDVKSEDIEPIKKCLIELSLVLTGDLLKKAELVG